MRKNQVIIIYGAPACGKYTMAKRLAQEEGFLLDNHYFHDMFKNLIEVPEERKDEYFVGVGEMKKSFFKLIETFYPKEKFVRYIFTSCLNDKEGDKLLRYKEFAEKLDADYVPIELKANLEVLKERCQTEYRKWRKKISNPEKLEKVFNEGFLKSPQFEYENKLLLDTSDLSEDETFEKIKNHLEKFE